MTALSQAELDVHRTYWREGETPVVESCHCETCGLELALEGPLPGRYDDRTGERHVEWKVRCPRQTRSSLVAMLLPGRTLHDHFMVVRMVGRDGTVDGVPLVRIGWR